MANKKKTYEQFVIDYNRKYPNITVMSIYSGIRNDIDLHCNLCEHDWTKKAIHAYGCPNCKHALQTYTHNDYLTELAYSELYRASQTTNLSKECGFFEQIGRKNQTKSAVNSTI